MTFIYVSHFRTSIFNSWKSFFTFKRDFSSRKDKKNQSGFPIFTQYFRALLWSLIIVHVEEIVKIEADIS